MAQMMAMSQRRRPRNLPCLLQVTTHRGASEHATYA